LYIVTELRRGIPVSSFSPSICIPGFHRCWQYHPHLEIIFPFEKKTYPLQLYIEIFFSDIGRARTITNTDIASVAYCCTRGSTSYPFLIVHMRNPHFQHPPISLKLEGDDSSEKTPWVTVGRVGSTVRGLVGTWRYDVCQTVAFPDYGTRPKLEDLIALAELAHERDCTRAAFPVALFFALKTFFNGTCSSKTKPRSRKAAILASLDIADEAKSAVIDAFPARQRRMEEQIERHCYRIVTLYVRPVSSVRKCAS
jgi:hypothetical protein